MPANIYEIQVEKQVHFFYIVEEIKALYPESLIEWNSGRCSIGSPKGRLDLVEWKTLYIETDATEQQISDIITAHNYTQSLINYGNYKKDTSVLVPCFDYDGSEPPDSVFQNGMMKYYLDESTTPVTFWMKIRLSDGSFRKFKLLAEVI